MIVAVRPTRSQNCGHQWTTRRKSCLGNAAMQKVETMREFIASRNEIELQSPSSSFMIGGAVCHGRPERRCLGRGRQLT